MLCELCKALVTDILCGKIAGNSSWTSLPHGYSHDHGPLKHLAEHAVSKTCDLCYMMMQVSYFDSSDPSDSIEPLPLPGIVDVNLTIDHESPRPWKFWARMPVHSPQDAPTPYFHNTYEYEFFSFDLLGSVPSSQSRIRLNHVDVNLSQLTSSLLVDDLKRQEDLAAHIAMIQKWSLTCLQTHPSCSHRKESQRLPTRVLDVGTIDGLEEPYLFESNGKRGTYITLSHRWGIMSKQFRTTKANLNDHQTQISLQDFPALFQDTIEVTRLLGIRYLWIDCLCIVQDDGEDWERECGRMASIYENSYLTISALLATHSGQGLFATRLESVEPVLFRMLDGKLVGLRPSTPSLTDAVKSSVLDTRGWILQERVLSPAILHFGDSQAYWECPGGQAEGVYPVMQSHASSLIKNLLHEAQRPGCDLYPQGHFIAWYKIIEKYTRKRLTVERDRLTAILGMATRFQKLFGVTFLAGLWAEDLHRGLLWRDLTKGSIAGMGPLSNRERKKHQVISPSWSWVNCGAPVAFEWESSLKFPSCIHPVARIISNTDADFIDAYTRACRGMYRGAKKGSIQLWGVVKRVRWLSRMVDKHHKRDVLRRRLKTSEVELPCVMDFEFEAPKDCYCAIIADWTFDDSWKDFFRRESKPLNLRCYLVLQRTRNFQRHRNPFDLGKFKRIGVGAASIADVEQFFSSERKHFLTLV
jgi:hypothetical protein